MIANLREATALGCLDTTQLLNVARGSERALYELEDLASSRNYVENARKLPGEDGAKFSIGSTILVSLAQLATSVTTKPSDP